MSTTPASALPVSAVLLCFDGVVHVSDLPVQAFARHLTDQLPAEQIRSMIGGMRGFLEGKTELIPPGIDLSPAEDGYQAVDILARAAGLGDAAVRTARLGSRADLAASAWAVDPAEGVEALLEEVTGRTHIALLIEPADPAVTPIIESLDLAFDEFLNTPVALAVAHIMEQVGVAPSRLLIIGTRWSDQLQPADEAGCSTALIDRYRRGRGRPTFRSADLAGLLALVRDWLNSDPASPTTRTLR